MQMACGTRGIVNKVKRGSVFVEGVNGDEYVMVKTVLSSLVYLTSPNLTICAAEPKQTHERIIKIFHGIICNQVTTSENQLVY